jgi:hypothetical protein
MRDGKQIRGAVQVLKEVGTNPGRLQISIYILSSCLPSIPPDHSALLILKIIHVLFFLKIVFQWYWVWTHGLVLAKQAPGTGAWAQGLYPLTHTWSHFALVIFQIWSSFLPKSNLDHDPPVSVLCSLDYSHAPPNCMYLGVLLALLSGLALNHNSLVLCLLNSLDYRNKPPCLALY